MDPRVVNYVRTEIRGRSYLLTFCVRYKVSVAWARRMRIPKRTRGDALTICVFVWWVMFSLSSWTTKAFQASFVVERILEA